jgi:UDP-GlcNAc:undecaprenyl-phosphate GlcNAc-1-phosphate transferase
VGVHGFVIYAVVTAFVITITVQPLVIRAMRRHGVVDLPENRRCHLLPTPRGGGIALLLGLAAATVAAAVAQHPLPLPVVVTALCFGLLGLAEDLHGVSVGWRLTLQLGLGLLAALALVSADRHWLLVVPAALFVAAYVNAFNFMDGINGIAGANALATAAVFAVLGLQRASTDLVVGSLVVAALSAGFLPWNAVRARVFLGDVGSYALGAAIAVLALTALTLGVPVEAVAAPLFLYGADTGWTLVRRIRSRQPWRQAHRDHVYQRLTTAGLSHVEVAMASAGGALVLSAIALAGVEAGWPRRLLAAGYVATPRLMSRRAVPASPLYTERVAA